MTQQSSCYHCRFYVPNMLAKTQMLADNIIKAIDSKEKTEECLTRTERKLKKSENNVRSLLDKILAYEITESTHYGEF